MLVVNLFAGPSVGKSLLAADVFRLLKRSGINAELPPEVAKEHAYRKDRVMLADQMKLFGDTNAYLEVLRRDGATQVAIVDSPLLLSCIYRPTPYYASFDRLVREVHDSYNNVNFLLQRLKTTPFSQVGRVHDEASSQKKDAEIRDFLNNCGIEYQLTDSSEHSALGIADAVQRLVLAQQPDNVRALRSSTPRVAP